MTVQENDALREHVRERYAAAALAVNSGQGSGCCGAEAEDTASGCGPGAGSTLAATEAARELDESFGAGLYSKAEQDELPAEALAASLGCGNPIAVADLHPGERVLDLGSGGGIDVLLSARRVGESGFAYGVDMTDEMLTLARANAAKAGATNVEFRKGTIEDIPLSDASVDVVISNCVINLSTDKAAVLSEMFRVLAPGGRIGISDVVAQDDVTPEQRAERGSYVGCIAGALSSSEYLSGLAAVGFLEATVDFTHEAAPGMHGAIVRAVKPAPLVISLARRAAAEAVGTAFLVVAVIGSGIAAQRLSPNDVGLQLLENSLITGAALVALILALQPVSAAFNPIVTLLERAFGALSSVQAATLIAAQLAGGVLGAVVANLMFGDVAVSISSSDRSGGGLWLGEVVATLGLMLVIFGTVRAGRADRVAYAVGSYITAAYWFTSSTSFANPAVTVARMFSDSFAGIAPASVPMFVLMQIIGGAAGYLLIRMLYPDPPGLAAELIGADAPGAQSPRRD